jgi:hypothetical protein
MSDENALPNGNAGQARSLAHKLTAGAALVALPVVGVYAYVRAKASVDSANARDERGFQYDMESLKKVDPALVKWHEVGRLATALPSARAIAVDKSGNILVGGDSLIRKLGHGVNPMGDIPVSGPVAALAVDGDGTIYAAVGDHVELFGPDGVRKATWPSLGSQTEITSIAVGGGSVYVADFGQRLVHRLDMAGKQVNVIGKADRARNVDGLLLPSPHMDVAVAADGSVWLADTGRHRLENYTPEGNLERFWGEQGTAIERFLGCCNPTDFWLMPDGSFITAEKGVARIKRYLPDGRFDSVVAAPASFPENMVGVDVTADAQGRVIVLARGAGAVQVFERNQ